MKLSDIVPGSDVAYREAVRLVREQIAFELESCEILLGLDPKRLAQLVFDPTYITETGGE